MSQEKLFCIIKCNPTCVCVSEKPHPNITAEENWMLLIQNLALPNPNLLNKVVLKIHVYLYVYTYLNFIQHIGC